jgi:cytoskeletal protein RodZ
MTTKVTLGEALKSIRIEKNYSIKEVSLSTRIAERFISAFENNQREELPSNVQAKGYLRNLLAFYHLDEKTYLDAWDSGFLVIEEKIGYDNAQNSSFSSELDSAPAENLEAGSISDEELPNTSREVFTRIGKQLASRRIQIGLNLTEAEDYTRIKDHNLSFLEKGAFDQIPSPVQARGMLKIYAEFLELDKNLILQEYAEGLRMKRLEQIALENQPTKKTPAVQFKKSSFLSGILTPDFLVVSSVVLALLIAVVWGSSYVIAMKQEADWEKLGIDRDIATQTTASPSPTQSETPIMTQLSTNAVPINTTPLSENVVTEPSNAPIQVNITVQQRTWVRVTADEKIVLEGRILPGVPYNFSASSQLNVLTGNAGAIQILFNNQYLGNLGIRGELAEFVFTTEGFITPTPQYSPTPTVTPQPSITPTFTPIVPTATVTPFIP